MSISGKTIDPALLPYRRGVGMVLFNKTGLVFAGRRLDTDADAWQFPQGGIDDGETPLEAALRELKEEIGTDAVAILAETPGWLTYDLPADLLGKVWRGRFRGQQQKWFALSFLGQDSDIDIRTSHPEFGDWRWMTLDQTVERIVPFKRALYRDIAASFRPFAARE